MIAHFPNARTTGFAWLKSSYSSGDQSCIEAATTLGLVPVRDSKDPDGPALALSPEAWSSFIAAIKNGNLDAI